MSKKIEKCDHSFTFMTLFLHSPVHSQLITLQLYLEQKRRKQSERPINQTEPGISDAFYDSFGHSAR